MRYFIVNLLTQNYNNSEIESIPYVIEHDKFPSREQLYKLGNDNASDREFSYLGGISEISREDAFVFIGGTEQDFKNSLTKLES